MASKIKQLLHMGHKNEEVEYSHAPPASTLAVPVVPVGVVATQAMPLAAPPPTRAMPMVSQPQQIIRPTTTTTETDYSNQALLDEGDAFLNSMQAFTPTLRRYVESHSSFSSELGNLMQKAPTPRRHQNAMFAGMAMSTGGSMPQQGIASGGYSSYTTRLEQEMLQPLNEWEHAYDSAKERMRDLARLRMQYDAAGRRFESVYGATKTTITTTQGNQSQTQTEIDSASMQSAKHAMRLAHLKAKYGPGMAEYESLVSQLNIHLNWLVAEAQRIKAYFASILSQLREVSVSGNRGLLLPFPQGVLGPFPSDLWANGRDDGYDEAEWIRIHMPPPPPQLVQVPVAVVMKDVEVAGPEVTIQEEGIWRDEGFGQYTERIGGFDEPATQRLRNSLNDMTMGGGDMTVQIGSMPAAGEKLPRGYGAQM